MSLILIRHAESMGNVWENIFENDSYNFLTLKGIKQAELAAYDIEDEINSDAISHVLTSNMTRTKQTATIILQSMNDWKRQYVAVPEFNEFGFEASLDDNYLEYENQTEFVQRVIKGYELYIKPLLDSCQEEHVLIVTHFFVMQVLLHLLEYGNIDNFVLTTDETNISHAKPFVFDYDY